MHILIPPAAPESMYVYEGEDYSKVSDSDKKTFDQLLAGTLTTVTIAALLQMIVSHVPVQYMFVLIIIVQNLY